MLSCSSLLAFIITIFNNVARSLISAEYAQWFADRRYDSRQDRRLYADFYGIRFVPSQYATAKMVSPVKPSYRPAQGFEPDEYEKR